jgi:flagellar motor switch protein FliN/FliY
MANFPNLDSVAKAMVDELALACGARLGGEATSAPTDVPTSAGWTLTIPVTGSVDGRIAVWFDRDSAAACARLITPATDMPTDEAVARLLVELVTEAGRTLCGRDESASIQFGTPDVSQGHVSNGARAVYIAVPNTASCLLAVGVDRSAAVAAAADDRMDTVLNVDLPIVVRFGRTVMPLHAVAELGPGSVIDMGRSPEEPVDLLVGDRVIARGEVVVVSGNYGVRITHLTGGDDATAMVKERRAS